MQCRAPSGATLHARARTPAWQPTAQVQPGIHPDHNPNEPGPPSAKQRRPLPHKLEAYSARCFAAAINEFESSVASHMGPTYYSPPVPTLQVRVPPAPRGKSPQHPFTPFQEDKLFHSRLHSSASADRHMPQQRPCRRQKKQPAAMCRRLAYVRRPATVPNWLGQNCSGVGDAPHACTHAYAAKRGPVQASHRGCRSPVLACLQRVQHGW